MLERCSFRKPWENSGEPPSEGNPGVEDQMTSLKKRQVSSGGLLKSMWNTVSTRSISHPAADLGRVRHSVITF